MSSSQSDWQQMDKEKPQEKTCLDCLHYRMRAQRSGVCAWNSMVYRDKKICFGFRSKELVTIEED